MKIKYSAPYELEQHGDMIDLKAWESVNMNKGDIVAIKLLFNIQLKKGLTMTLVSRSSNPTKKGIGMANDLGIIDSNFKGKRDLVSFVAQAFRDTKISKGDRIAQFTIQPAMNCPLLTRLRFYLFGIKLEKVDIESNKNKDRGGLGQSGM